MRTFYIQQGQGVMARGDVQIKTATLYSCSLVAGYNAGSGYCGGYHLSSNTIDRPAVQTELQSWAAILRPTALVFVHARSMGWPGDGSPQEDMDGLLHWAQGQTLPAPTVQDGVNVASQVLGGVFSVGAPALMPAFDFGSPVLNLQHQLAGRYGWGDEQYTILGFNREIDDD